MENGKLRLVHWAIQDCLTTTQVAPLFQSNLKIKLILGKGTRVPIAKSSLSSLAPSCCMRNCALVVSIWEATVTIERRACTEREAPSAHLTVNILVAGIVHRLRMNNKTKHRPALQPLYHIQAAYLKVRRAHVTEKYDWGSLCMQECLQVRWRLPVTHPGLCETNS